MSKKAVTVTCISVILGIILFFFLVFGMKKLQVIGSTKDDFSVETSQTQFSTEIIIEETTSETSESISKEDYYEIESQNDDNTENEIWESQYQGDSESTETQLPMETEEEKEVQPEEVPETQVEQQDPLPYYIKVNRLANCVTVYGKDEQGNYSVPVKAMVCSVGLYGNTPLGVFKTSTKYSWRYLYGDVYGQYAYRIKGPILFHSVPYYNKDKGTLKSEEYNKLGEAASLGCVRLAVQDAKWLIDNCPQGTTVEIYESEDPGPLGKPTPLRIDTSSPNKGWDPTDPDTNNPWLNGEPLFAGVTDRIIELGEECNLLDGVTASDNFGNPLEVTIEGTVDTKVLGEYIITYSATNQSGVTAQRQANIKVVDTGKPTLEIKSQFVINDENKQNLMESIYAGTIALDNGEPLDISQVVFDIEAINTAITNFAYGTYQGCAMAVDLSGNQSEKVFFEVAYLDQTPPVITVSGETLGTQIERGENTEEQLMELAKTSAIECVSIHTSVDERSFYTNVLQVESIEKEYEEEVLKKIKVNIKVSVLDAHQNQAEIKVPVLVEIKES